MYTSFRTHQITVHQLSGAYTSKFLNVSAMLNLLYDYDLSKIVQLLFVAFICETFSVSETSMPAF